MKIGRVSIRVDRDKLLITLAYMFGAMIGGYYGASLAQAQRDFRACEVEMEECHLDWSIWGFEVVGRGEKQ